MRRIVTLLLKKQTSITTAALILMTMVFTSRVLGLVRDRLLSARFGPDALGVYFAAFRLPNLIFELLVMGILTTAFIPIFTKYVTQEKEDIAWQMAGTLINITVLVTLFLALPVFIWAPVVSRFLAPGFSPVQIEEMASFTRFMVVCQVVPLMIGNFLTGILQSYNLFFIPAMAPVVYNLGIILGILFLSPIVGLFAPVIGVGIGAMLFMLIQVPLLLKLGYRHSFSVNPQVPGVKDVVKLMLPRTLGLAVSQIDTTADLVLASLLGARMVTIFTFAQNLQQLPIGLFGATIAQAALPHLSAASVKEDRQKFTSSLISAIHQILFFVLPASALFIVLRIPVVRLVFGSSRFDWPATVLTGATLSMFSISLFAQAMVHVLARGFYALYDSKTPVAVGVVSILVNTLGSVLFVMVLHLPVWSLGLSTSIASIINAGTLLFLLDRRMKGMPRRDLLFPPLKMVLAAGISGSLLYILMKLLDQLVFDTTRTFNLILLTGITGGMGLTTYLFLSWVFGVGEVRAFLGMLGKVRRAGRIILEPASEVVSSGVQDKLS